MLLHSVEIKHTKSPEKRVHLFQQVEFEIRPSDYEEHTEEEDIYIKYFDTEEEMVTFMANVRKGEDENGIRRKTGEDNLHSA